MSDLSAEQIAELKILIRKHGLEAGEAQILGAARNAILLEAIDAAASREPNLVGATRLGGLPDVPANWQWPENLAFLAQINCAEMRACDANSLLPESGLLLFFLDDLGWEESGLPCQVQWIEDDDEGTRELRRAGAPRGYLPHSLGGEGGNVVFKSLPVEPQRVLTLPAYYSHEVEEIRALTGDGDELFNLQGEIENYVQQRHRHQVLGSHSSIDHDAREEAWAASAGVSLYGSPREYSVQDRAEIAEWTLLFQMGSDDRVGTMFNDAGVAYFMIRRSDLADRRFDRVYASLWSS